MRTSRAALVVVSVLCTVPALLSAPAVAQPMRPLTLTGRPAATDRHPLASVRFHRPQPSAPTIALGEGNPVGVAVNSETRTAYVGDADGIDVVDISRCTSRRHNGCAQTITKVPGHDIVTLALDQVTGTVYAGSIS